MKNRLDNQAGKVERIGEDINTHIQDMDILTQTHPNLASVGWVGRNPMHQAYLDMEGNNGNLFGFDQN